MQQRILLVAALAISLLVFGYSCNKLDTTKLGSDLVTVDNVNTFLAPYDVKTTQGVFLDASLNPTDSTVVFKNSNHVLGNVNDPQFGTTEAAIYVQFKPTFYPFYFGGAGDTVKGLSPASVVGLDSIVLCLSYKGVWGDSSATSAPQTFEVRTISSIATNATFKDRPDTLWGLRYRPPGIGSFLGSAIYTPQKTREYARFGRPSGRDSINNQIRIKLDTTILGNLFRQDTSALATSTSDAFKSDSLFRERFRGFEIKSTSSSGNTLYYVNLAEANSRLEFHFRKRKSNVLDTVMQAFQVYPSSNTVFGVKASSSTNYVKRTLAPQVTNPAAKDLYIQSAPGTFVHVEIPGLDALRNQKDKIIHRAYLIVEQNDNIVYPQTYTAPAFMYLDIKDSINAIPPNPQKYKPMYFDLSQRYFYSPDADGITQSYHPYPQGNVDPGTFGGVALQRSDATGNFIRYEFNITRYVQHIVSNNFKNYELRIFAPFNYYYPQFETKYVIPFYNQLAAGRVRVGAGAFATPSNNLPRKMRMEIIYSKVK